MALIRIPVPADRMREWRREFFIETGKFISETSAPGRVGQFQDWLCEKIDHMVNLHHPFNARDWWCNWDLVCEEHEAVQVKLTWL